MIIEVQTTQNVTIDYETAGLGQRILAYLIDWVVILIWVFGWIWLFSKIVPYSIWDAGDYLPIIIWVMYIVPVLFYDFIFETLNYGQSPGKMVMNIRVINLDGTTPSTGSYLLRWLFRLVDFSLTNAVVGVIMVAVNKKNQRLGDLLAGTTVVDLKLNSRNRRLSITDLDFRNDYKVTYADVLDKLSDKDIQTIMSITEDARMRENEYFNQRLAERVKDITGYTFDGPDRLFLKKIVSDYNYMAIQY
ncbi:RDD family protein [Dysgonomonas sp. 511]|uniref:RDD family protein n=1 Tax=Dysgonomonas sp. 511 TaxID=2302930 RepID=UPI0013D7BBFF|nr:RDD family protein [Dysgonomonas sp. 511]NDV77935.1 RDD family protein [Dysgonomonas sp. 511]